MMCWRNGQSFGPLVLVVDLLKQRLPVGATLQLDASSGGIGGGGVLAHMLRM